MTTSALSRHPTQADAPGAGLRLQPDDRLHVAMPKRMVVQRGVSDEGAAELHLFYGDKEITFDEPHLFGFGETLARQSAFRAGDAVAWAQGSRWDEIAPLLETLIEEGIVEAGDGGACPMSGQDRARPSLLPPAPARTAASWHDCARITQDLAGRAVDPGHLELVVPVFRIAHPVLDDDGRQVGEANVFPRALRLEAPTEWLACTYAGTRYLSERPMNATALRAMRSHWDDMMAALRALRAIYLDHFPDAARAWTVGHVERLATFVLAVPTYQLMRTDGARIDRLHPVLSSLFRVTDGLRMAMHQMMFVPLGEPMVSFDAEVTAAGIHDYAERNYSFHSETGVCAGPRMMVERFLRVLLEADGADRGACVPSPVQAALDDAEPALAYACHGLRAHAAIFSLWPLVGRTYEQLAAAAPSQAMQRCIDVLRKATYIGREDWRAARERTYARMFDAAGTGGEGLRARIRAGREPHPRLAAEIEGRMNGAAGADGKAVAGILAEFALEAQAILRVAESAQADVNALLGRPAPRRAFEIADANVHNLLQEQRAVRLPFLLDEIREQFAVALTIASDRIDVASAPDHRSAETTSAETRAEALLKEGVP